MKGKILLFAVLISAIATAQNKPAVFAVTDQVNGAFGWNSIRDISAESPAKIVVENAKSKGSMLAARSGATISAYNENNFKDQPMFTGVAALAFDQQRNRLYFSTMMSRQLRYINLGESDKCYQVSDLNTFFTKPGDEPLSNNNQAGVITRMTIGASGYGYGLSNDGQNFFRFSLDKKGSPEPLGALIDAPENKSVSVHNACMGWGGDMVSAATGELYLFTMRHQVFKIQPETRVATYLGSLKGLPENFTINGAAVIGDDEIMLSTAAYSGVRGIITNLSSLEATVKNQPDYFNASDLASGKQLFESKKTSQNLPVFPLLVNDNDKISIYPNPVTNGLAAVEFNQAKAGRYNIELINATGKTVQRKTVQISGDGSRVNLETNRIAKGFYTLRVIDPQNKAQFSGKLVVQ